MDLWKTKLILGFWHKLIVKAIKYKSSTKSNKNKIQLSKSLYSNEHFFVLSPFLFLIILFTSLNQKDCPLNFLSYKTSTLEENGWEKLCFTQIKYLSYKKKRF